MTYMTSLLGGLLIGTAAVWLLWSTGRIAGISGIAGRALNGLRGGTRELWPWLFVIGLGVGGWLAYWIMGDRPAVSVSAEQSLLLLLGGLLVGFGTRLGSGCTSGHGVCGMARFSRRSLVATLVFLSVGIVTATLLQWLGGAL